MEMEGSHKQTVGELTAEHESSQPHSQQIQETRGGRSQLIFTQAETDTCVEKDMKKFKRGSLKYSKV